MNDITKVAIAIGILAILLVGGILIVKEATTNHEEESITLKGIFWRQDMQDGVLSFEDRGFDPYNPKVVTFYYDGRYMCETQVPNGDHSVTYTVYVGNNPTIDHITWIIS